jgi:hypothetical protein
VGEDAAHRLPRINEAAFCDHSVQIVGHSYNGPKTSFSLPTLL